MQSRSRLQTTASASSSSFKRCLGPVAFNSAATSRSSGAAQQRSQRHQQQLQRQRHHSLPATAPRAFVAASSSAAPASRLWARRSAIVAMAAVGASGNDLLIVGPGVLGSYAGKLWKESFPNTTVVAQTNTTGSHERCVCRGLVVQWRSWYSCATAPESRGSRSMAFAVSFGQPTARSPDNCSDDDATRQTHHHAHPPLPGCKRWVSLHARVIRLRAALSASPTCCLLHHPPAVRTTLQRCVCKKGGGVWTGWWWMD